MNGTSHLRPVVDQRMSELAAALLAIGGPLREYGLELKYGIENKGMRFMDSFLTDSLRRDITVLLDRREKEPGWRKLEKAG